MKNLKWIPTPFNKLCPKKTWKMLFFPKNERNGTSYVLKIALLTLLWMQPTILSPELAVTPTRNMIRESRGYLLKSLDVQKPCVCVAKPIVTTIARVASTNSVASSKGLKQRTLEDCGDGPMSKYRKMLQEAVNVTSTRKRYRKIQHNVATYEQTKKSLSYFHPRRLVEEDGIHTKPLHW